MRIDLENGCVLLLDKPLEWTSFDVVNKLRYALTRRLHRFHGDEPGAGVKRKIKVGHAGTLDPLATGLLIVCVGKETKNIDQYMATDKEYTGSIFLGATTPSYDRETLDQKVEFEATHITEEMIREAASTFIGEISQVPPIFSAIKKEGKKLYHSARAGEEIKIEPRLVRIDEFEITQIETPLVYFRVVCSKGTYIRSLAFDFGKALSSGAYLNSLCRTRSGNYKLKDALSMEECLKQIDAPFE